MKYHSKLLESVEDKISYASLQYLRGNHRDALKLCKTIQALNR